jgi:hypothetical protein
MSGISRAGGGGGPTQVGGAGTAADSAAAQAAEAARKAAEAARKAAEAAKQAAEAAARQAAQAQAQAAKDPRQKPRAAVEQVHAESERAKANQSAKEASAAMRGANEAALKAGRRAPYPNELARRPAGDGFERAARPASMNLSGTPGTPAGLQGGTALPSLGTWTAGKTGGFAALTGNRTDVAAADAQAAEGGAGAQEVEGAEATPDQAETEGEGADPVKPEDREALHEMGFTDEEISQAGEALPDLIAAATAESPTEAIEHLSAAAEKAPALADKAWKALASRPEVQTFFQETLGIDITKLPNPSEALPKLIAVQEAIEGKDPAAITRAVLELAGSVDAKAFEGLYNKVLEQLPQGLKDLLGGWLGNENFQDLVKALVGGENFPQLVAAIASGDVDSIVAELLNNPEAMTAAGELLASTPAVQKLCETLGISLEDLPNLGEVLPKLVAMQKAIESKDPAAITQAALELAGSVDAKAFEGLYNKVLEQLPQGLKDLLGGWLGNENFQDLVKALVGGENFPQLVAAIADGNIDTIVAELLKNPEAITAAGTLITDLPAVRDYLATTLGLSPDEIASFGAALPEVLKAITSGDPKQALTHLLEAAKTINPEAAKKIFSHFATKLGIPAEVQSFILEALGNEKLQELVANPNFQTALGQIIGGEFDLALTTLANDPQLLGLVGQTLVSIPEVSDRLTEVLGVTADELTQMAGAIPELVAAYNAFKADDKYQMGLHLMKALASVPAHLIQGMFNRVAEKIGLDPRLKATVDSLLGSPDFASLISNADFQVAVSQLLAGDPMGALKTIAANPELVGKVSGLVANALGVAPEILNTITGLLPFLADPEVGAALDALLKGVVDRDPNAILGALDTIAQKVSEKANSTDPAQQEQVISLLNALGTLPGGVGKLFSNPDLNRQLVQSGSIGHVFTAAKHLANGNLAAAAEEIYHAAESLLTSGTPLEVAGQQLPFSGEGLQALHDIFQVFFDALPNGVKNQIKSIVARAAGSVMPFIGDIITGAMDVKAFIDAMKDGDGLDQLIAGGQLVLDAAGVFQFSKPLTTPLKFVLGGLQAFRAINDMRELVSNATNIFLGIDADPEVEVDNEHQIVVEGYFGEHARVEELRARYPELADDEGFSVLVQAAQAAGVSPENFEAFLNMLISSAGEEYDDPEYGLADLMEFLKFGLQNNPLGGSGQPAIETRLNYLLSQQLGVSTEEIASVGGSLPQQTVDQYTSTDSYPISEQEQQDFEARFGEQGDSVLKGLIAMARAMGVDPSQFVEFCEAMDAEAKKRGLTLDSMGSAIYYSLTNAEDYNGGGEVPVVDVESEMQGMFAIHFPGVADPFLAPAPAAAA